MPALDISYCNGGSWGLSRPQTMSSNPSANTNRPPIFSVLAASLAGDSPEETRVVRLGELLQKHMPAFCPLSGVTQSLYTLIRDNPVVRQHYGITQYHNCGCCVLMLISFTGGYAETEGRGERPVISVTVFRPFPNLLDKCVVSVISLDPNNQVATRYSAIADRLKHPKGSDSEVSILFGNFFETVHSTDAMRVELPRMIQQQGRTADWKFALETTSDDKEVLPQSTHGILYYQSRREESKMVSVSTQRLCDAHVAAATLTTFKLPFSIPVPRSATHTVQQQQQPQQQQYHEKSLSPKAPTTPASIDPAVVTLVTERGPSTGGVAASIGRQLQQSQQQQQSHYQHQQQSRGPSRHWSVEHAIDLRKGLTQEEELWQYNRGKSVHQVVEMLNSGELQWDYDYIVVHQTLLWCDGVRNTSYHGFKKYVEKQPHRSRHVAAPIDVDTPTVRSESMMSPHVSINQHRSAAAAGSGSGHSIRPRIRKWSEQSVTVVYELTPREKNIFDITTVMSTDGKETLLKRAIERLNGISSNNSGSAADALNNYSHDYALLYSRDRHGYWLLSPIDVPCDIIAFREYARLYN